MKKIWIIAALVALTLTASSGLAAPQGPGKQFTAGDTNGDGSLSKQEFMTMRLVAAKKAAEKNNQEYNAEAMGKRLEKVFENTDANADGQLSAEEFSALGSGNKKKQGQGNN